jgi:hypothetical protein
VDEKGLPGSQERPGQEQQLAHDGGDDDLGTLALDAQALGKTRTGGLARMATMAGTVLAVALAGWR